MHFHPATPCPTEEEANARAVHASLFAGSGMPAPFAVGERVLPCVHGAVKTALETINVASHLGTPSFVRGPSQPASRVPRPARLVPSQLSKSRHEWNLRGFTTTAVDPWIAVMRKGLVSWAPRPLAATHCKHVICLFQHLFAPTTDHAWRPTTTASSATSSAYMTDQRCTQSRDSCSLLLPISGQALHRSTFSANATAPPQTTSQSCCRPCQCFVGKVVATLCCRVS